MMGGRKLVRAYMALMMMFGLAVSSVSADTVWLDQLDVTKAYSGFGTTQANKSVDGVTLSIGDKKFERGLGTHSTASFTIDLGKAASRFRAVVGVDDESNAAGTVEFKIVGDGKALWKSGVLTWKDLGKTVDVSLDGVSELRLEVTDGGDDDKSDHADWCDARIDFEGQRPKAVGIWAGAAEDTPSRSQYFSWINNTNEGATEEQTLTNLDFFKWLQDEYGMVLDIYAFDAGAIDGPNYYGSPDTDKFRNQFPNGFDPMYKKAKDLGTRLGIWGGPDGFGDTPEEEQKRIDLMVSLCRDYEFMLFKFDAVCGQLRADKQDAFARLMMECRKASPDLILLNHRLALGKATPHATTFLWGGAETYIDVWMSNSQTASHNRAGALQRGMVPGLRRLTEDHGVCLSSCIDYWDDDLILQAFNRNLILAPEIYGNPWFLRDDEFPKLARIYNLHKRWRDIMVNGTVLPSEQYGPNAVSRGDVSTRLITLRNLTWESVKYRVNLGEEIGLLGEKKIELRRLHPSERVIGRFDFGESVEVEVLPFRACLLLATSKPCPEISVEGADYEVVRDVPGKPVLIKVLGMPGTKANLKLNTGDRKFKSAKFGEGRDAMQLVKGKTLQVTFPGAEMFEAWHRQVADLSSADVPADAESLYEATCYAADSNALEARCLDRSGPTEIPQVQKARNAFFEQDLFIERAVWDRFAFDGDEDTWFKIGGGRFKPKPIEGGSFRIEFGAALKIDKLVLRCEGLEKFEAGKAEVSADLKTWVSATVSKEGDVLTVAIPFASPVRYFRLAGALEAVREINGFCAGEALDRSKWRASNLFGAYAAMPAVRAWTGDFVLNDAAPGSYFCVAINGKHGVEGSYAALRVNGKPVGAPNRARSYRVNPWEYHSSQSDKNYTYYFPVTDDMVGARIDVVVMGMKNGTMEELKPEAWITTYPNPFEEMMLVLE